MKNKKLIALFSLLLVFLGALASAGGGGGGSSGGGGGGDGDGIGILIYFLIRLIMMLPFPLNIIVVAIIIFAVWKASKNYKAVSGFNSIPTAGTYGALQQSAANEAKTIAALKNQEPEFDTEKFKQKVRTAFISIQNAWMQQNLGEVRKWITDGVYQRFNTQFMMMQEIGQVNQMSDIRVNSVVIDDAEQDGAFSIVHVGISYSMMDSFVSKKYTKLNDGGPLHTMEYWSFIKKSGVKEADLYHTNNCPKCGGELGKDGGETAKCPYCQTITYLGDYDWVLAEITQRDDYHNSNSKYEKQGKSAIRIREQMGDKKDFSLQELEDKASNGYMQIMTALVKQEPERVRRFVTDNLYQTIEKKIQNDPKFVYHRLYLNHVTTFDYFKEGNIDNLVVAIKRSSQRIVLADPKNHQFEGSIRSFNEVLVLSRDANAQKAQGSLYAHSCPNCGAPVKDTIDTNCTYCSAQLNSPKYEWIIREWMDAGAYEQWRQGIGLLINNKIDVLDEIFDVRDYAFNNMLMMIAADGKLTDEEIEFANTLAKKWGYNVEKIQALLEMATNRKLVLRLPQDMKKRGKIITMMEKTANLDNNFSMEEQQLMQEVKSLN